MTNPNQLTRTIQHLTPRELDRLLHSYRISEIARDHIWLELEMESNYLAEIASEQLAEYGRATVRKTPFDAYCQRNPVHGPAFAPAWSLAADDDCPF